MKLRGTSQDLSRVPTDTLVLSFFQDERPLKGQAGLADWRLCGRLSRLIVSQFVDGHFGEPLLMPATPQVPAQKILVLGLGPRGSFDLDRYRNAVTQICDALAKLRVNQFALALPGLDLTELDPADAAEVLGKVIPTRFGHDREVLDQLEVTVIADRQHLKAINPVLARLERSIR